MTYDISNLFSTYNDRPLLFSEVFTDYIDFQGKLVSVGGLEDLSELYRLLALRYSFATTMYVIEEPFIMAIKRKLEYEWPTYITRKTLYEQMRNIEISKVMNQNTRSINKEVTGTSTRDYNSNNLQNQVQTNDTPVTNADTVPIKDLSTMQINNKLAGDDANTFNNQDVITDSLDGNELEAILVKYEAMNKNLLDTLYARLDVLFRAIL